MVTAKKKINKKMNYAVVGIVLLVLGITLTLVNWSAVVIFFQGVIGIALAIAGLFVLYMMKDE
jgi:hypothetical protein